MSFTIIDHAIPRPYFTENPASVNLGFTAMRLSKGAMPWSPSVVIAASATTWLDNSSVIAISQSNFTGIVGGKCQLIAPITIPIRASQVAQIPTFMRLQSANTSTTGFYDIEVNSTAGPSNAVINSMSISTADVVQITDLRFALKPQNDLKMTPILYDAMLHAMIGRSFTPGYNGSLFFGWPKIMNNAGGESNAVLAIEAWDGIPPESSEDDATGTLLWKRTIPTTETSIFSTTNGLVISNRPHVTNAVANGVPTYIRVVKNAITSSPYVYPKMTLQLEVGKHVSFYRPTMITGQPNTLDMFSFHLLPI